MSRYQFPSSRERSAFLSYGAAVRHSVSPRRNTRTTALEIGLVAALVLIAILSLISY